MISSGRTKRVTIPSKSFVHLILLMLRQRIVGLKIWSPFIWLLNFNEHFFKSEHWWEFKMTVTPSVLPIFREMNILQVNLCQKLSFLNQLNHNMTWDCSLNYKKNTSSEHVVYKYCFECQNKKLFFLQMLMLY